MNKLSDLVLLGVRVVYCLVAVLFWSVLITDSSKYNFVFFVESFWVLCAVAGLAGLVGIGVNDLKISNFELLLGVVNTAFISIASLVFYGFALGLLMTICLLLALCFIAIASFFIGYRLVDDDSITGIEFPIGFGN